MFFRIYRIVFLYTWVYLFIFWVHWLTECDIITLCLQVKEQNHLETHSSGSHLSHLPCVIRPSLHTVNCQNRCRQLPKSPAAQTIHSSLIFLLSCVTSVHCCLKLQKHFLWGQKTVPTAARQLEMIFHLSWLWVIQTYSTAQPSTQYHGHNHHLWGHMEIYY